MIGHEVSPPLDEDSLSELAAQLGNVPELLEFYRHWGSVRLYCDTVFKPPVGHASAFYIAPPEAWAELKDDFERWTDNLDDDERQDLLPAWIDSFVVVGEVPNSGNYFLVPLEGDDRGKVFEFEHDGFEFIERGSTFAGFVEQISTVNEALLAEILGHTRYADGQSSVQWLCEQYLFDDGAA